MAKNKILIVDDEPGSRFGIRDFLETKGFEVEEAESCQSAIEQFRSTRPDIAIVDHKLPDGNALDLLPRLREIDQSVPLIVLTGHASIDLAVKAIKEGAEHFLTKPVELPALAIMLQRVLEHQRNRRKQLAGKTRQGRRTINPFMGKSAAIVRLAEQAQRVLETESPVLILGETGAGKGVLASWLHQQGPRAEEAFVDLNCAGLTRELLETELFGHERGAFTGATASKVGLFEVAHRGTVFLDEIGDIDLLIQPKLLKVLEEKRFRRLGDVRDRQVDVRLIAATSQDLNLLIKEKKFRSDLYYRISTIPLTIPPLRARVEDIPLLAQQFLEEFSTELGRGNITLSASAAEALTRYSWPGNIRELRNVLERAVLLSRRGILDRQDLFFDTEAGGGEPKELSQEDASLTLLELEQQHIARVLRQERGQVEQAAQRLGIPRSSLYQKIKKYQIDITRI